MNQINELDLSKIAIKDVATKKIKANFDGTEREYTIRALTDGAQLELKTLISRTNDAMRIRKMYILLLSCGMGWEPDVCELLFDNCSKEALRVGDEIFKLSRVFEDAKSAEAEKAEKNSGQGSVSADTAPSSQVV